MSIFFLFFSFFLRIYININDNADNAGYRMWDFSAITVNFSLLFNEPLFYTMINFFYNVTGDRLIALEFMYYIIFFCSTFFFIWVASITDVASWKKVLLFTFYYILFTYTTLRNTPAYIFVGILFYSVQRNKKYYFGFLSFLAHTSSLPAIGSTLLGFKQPSIKFLILLILFSILAAFILQLPELSHISDKYEVYVDSETKNETSISHIIFFTGICLLSIFLFFNNKLYVYNNIYIFMFLLYIIMFFQSPVMAFRFSVYPIIFLCLHPYLKKDNKIDKILNNFSFFLFFYFIYTYYPNHPG